ncbi:unnamed protein product [Musa textilis]
MPIYLYQLDHRFNNVINYKQYNICKKITFIPSFLCFFSFFTTIFLLFLFSSIFLFSSLLSFYSFSVIM